MKEKLKKLAKENRVLAVIFGLAALFILIFIIMLFSILIGGGNDPYGDRLDGIEKVEISKKKLTNIESSINENDQVKESNVRIQGKIIYVTIDYINGVNLDKAKEIANSVLDEFSDDEKEFYDFEFLLKEETDESNSEYNPFKAAGTKHPSKDSITWTKS